MKMEGEMNNDDSTWKCFADYREALRKDSSDLSDANGSIAIAAAMLTVAATILFVAEHRQWSPP